MHVGPPVSSCRGCDIVGLLAGLAVGWIAATCAADRGYGGGGVSSATRDSLASALVQVADLEQARERSISRAVQDSAALEEARRLVRVVAAPAAVQSPVEVADVLPETTTVYQVPAPVAELVTRLEARVVTLQAALDTTALQLYAERAARALAIQVSLQAESALRAERGRSWRYRLEGAGIGGAVVAVALVLIAF